MRGSLHLDCQAAYIKQPSSRWDSMFQAGIRAHFIASRLAAPLLIEHQGLIINLSFFAAQRNDKGVAKAATDHMVACMAEELRKYNVATISLYPGVVRTEAVLKSAENIDLSNSESPQFIGRAVVALACDKRIMKKSGKRLIAANLGVEYEFKDIDGRQPKPISVDNI
jgi:dehydrogenase/reductase SDR family protein 1